MAKYTKTKSPSKEAAIDAIVAKEVDVRPDKTGVPPPPSPGDPTDDGSGENPYTKDPTTPEDGNSGLPPGGGDSGIESVDAEHPYIPDGGSTNVVSPSGDVVIVDHPTPTDVDVVTVDVFEDPVSPIEHPSPQPPQQTTETIYGDPIVLYPASSEIEFTGQLHQPLTISYNEQAKGWVSFKTFYPEQALSINNHYYSYVEGEMWQHHINPRRNNFYGVDANSTVDVIFNDAPSSVKGFQTIKYEGSQSRVNKFVTVVQNGVTYTDKEYYNLWEKCGWYVSYAETDLQTGKVPEFLNREGKWFNVIKGDCTTLENLDEREFSVQGLGFATMTHSDPTSVSPEVPIEDDKEDPRDEPHGGIVSIIVRDSGFDIDGTSWD
jgi:hypothetical protein